MDVLQQKSRVSRTVRLFGMIVIVAMILGTAISIVAMRER